MPEKLIVPIYIDQLEDGRLWTWSDMYFIGRQFENDQTVFLVDRPPSFADWRMSFSFDDEKNEPKTIDCGFNNNLSLSGQFTTMLRLNVSLAFQNENSNQIISTNAILFHLHPGVYPVLPTPTPIEQAAFTSSLYKDGVLRFYNADGIELSHQKIPE